MKYKQKEFLYTVKLKCILISQTSLNQKPLTDVEQPAALTAKRDVLYEIVLMIK